MPECTCVEGGPLTCKAHERPKPKTVTVTPMPIVEAPLVTPKEAAYLTYAATSTEVRITDPNTGGQKGQKLERFDLIPWAPLQELARVYGVGAQKYEADNWRRGYSWRLSYGALFRHLTAWILGEDRDSQTGCHHLAHVMWHCCTLMWFQASAKGTDDREGKTHE